MRTESLSPCAKKSFGLLKLSAVDFRKNLGAAVGIPRFAGRIIHGNVFAHDHFEHGGGQFVIDDIAHELLRFGGQTHVGIVQMIAVLVGIIQLGIGAVHAKGQCVPFVISSVADAKSLGGVAATLFEVSFAHTKMNGDVRLLTASGTGSENSPEAIIARINRYIQQNTQGDLSLSTLSALVGYNASYLSRLYSSHMGKNLSAYIAEVRFKYICELMKKDEMTIAEICDSAGFTTRVHFNRFIKRLSGMTPTELRKSLQD